MRQGNHDKETDESCKETPNLVENQEFSPTNFVKCPDFRSFVQKIIRIFKRGFGLTKANQPKRQKGKTYAH